MRVRVETQTLGTWRARKSTEELLLENVAQSDLDRLLSTTESVHFDGNEQKEDPVPDLIWRKCSSLKSFRGSFGVILAEDFAHLPGVLVAPHSRICRHSRRCLTGLSSMTLTDFRLGGEQQTQALNMTLCCTNLASLTLVDCDHYGALGTDATLLFNPTSLPSLSELVLIPATHESDRLASGTWKEAIKLLAPQLESFAFGSGAAELGQQNINWKLFGRLRRLFLNARADDLAAAISSIDMLSSDSLETLHVVIDAWDNNGAMPLLKMLIDKLSSTRPHLSTFRNLYIANTSLGNFYDDVEPEQAAAWRSLQVSTKQQDITLTTSSKFQISDPHLDSMEWTVYDDPWAQ